LEVSDELEKIKTIRPCGLNLFSDRTFSYSCMHVMAVSVSYYRGADKSLARPTSRYIVFDGENISFDASLVLYI